MRRIITFLYRVYQLFIVLPVFLVWTVFISLTVIIGCSLSKGHFWSYYPGRAWGWLNIRMLLLPVKVTGRENMEKGKSYVIVANHQGAVDIFLMYGFLRRNFKWMMKHQLKKVPFMGYACVRSHQIFVDKRGPKKVKETYDKARQTLRGGTSLVVFPEGSRTFTGHMGTFKRGAFMLAEELDLPVLPVTINGSFRVKPRMRDLGFAFYHPLSLTIHPAIVPDKTKDDDVRRVMQQSYASIQGALESEYQGYEENPDQ